MEKNYKKKYHPRYVVLDLVNRRFKDFDYEVDAFQYAEELGKKQTDYKGESWTWESKWVPAIQIIPLTESDIFYLDDFKESFIDEEK